MPTHLWLFGLLRMVAICFYFECKGNGFWAGMQSSFWFILVLLGGGFYAHPFFSRWGRLLLPRTRVAPPEKSGTSRLRACGGGNAYAHGYVSGEYTKKA